MKKIYMFLTEIFVIFILFMVGCTNTTKTFVEENIPNEEAIESSDNEVQPIIEVEEIIGEEEVIKVEEIIEDEEIIKEEEKSVIELIDEKVNELLGEYKDNVSIYFKNLNTNEEYTLNEDIYYFAASTTKVALSMSILDEVNNGYKSLDELLHFNKDDIEYGSGVLNYSEEIPNITIDEAIYLSIVYSDNTAKNMLLRVAKTGITDYMRKVTGDSIPYGNYATAKQLGILLDKLYKNPDNNPYYEKLIDYMTETSFHDRLDKYIDYDIVAHKIGTYYRYYHDIGIIYGEDPYILVVLTKDIGELSTESYENGGEDERYLLDWGEKACELIATLSEEIYNIVEESKI